MTLRNRLASLLGALALACSSASPSPSPPVHETAPDASPEDKPTVDHGGHDHGAMQAKHERMAANCPMKVPGTTVTLRDLPGAVALEFSTSGDPAELQRRVRHMAEHHRQRHGVPAASEGSEEKPHGHGEGMMMGHGSPEHRPMVAAQVSSEDTAQGARLIFTPEQATDLDALRQHLETHSKHMAEGRCGMMAGVHANHETAPAPTH
jgi:hypothetical protein